MESMSYIVRCIFMLLVTWTCLRIIGKKSISEMTNYDLGAMMLLTTVAAEPLVYKVASQALIGAGTITTMAVLIGILSLNKSFYNVDSRPVVIVANGKIIEKDLKKLRMNVPLLMSELRVKGYQNLSDVEFAIAEPSGKLSVIPKSQSRPIQPSDLTLATAPENLSFSLVVDGQINQTNLDYFNKDEKWLMEQLNLWGIKTIEEVFFAQMDSKGNIYVDKKNKEVKIPNLE